MKMSMKMTMKMHEADHKDDPEMEHDSELEQLAHSQRQLYYMWHISVCLTHARVGIGFDLPTQAHRTSESWPKRSVTKNKQVW